MLVFSHSLRHCINERELEYIRARFRVLESRERGNFMRKLNDGSELAHSMGQFSHDQLCDA
jgi:hypothetical protein